MSSDDEEEVVVADDGSEEVKLRLTDVAEMIHDDWQTLATQLHLTDTDISDVTSNYSYPSEQVSLSSTTVYYYRLPLLTGYRTIGYGLWIVRLRVRVSSPYSPLAR